MNPRSTSNAIANVKVFRALSYTLVFLTIACGVMTLGSFIQNVAPDAHAGVIAAVLLFIVIDRFYTYQHIKSLIPLSSEWVISLGAQWIVMMLLARFLLSYANGLDSFITEMSRIARGYIVDLFTPEFVFTLFLSLLVWYLCGQLLGLLDEAGLDQQLVLREDPAPIQFNVIPAHQRLVNLVFGVGIVLVILSALARLNLNAIVSNPTGIPSVELNHLSGGEAGALLYFVFALALLSLSRLMSLQSHWNQLRIPVSSKNLARQWGLYSLFFLLILAVIVSLLPAGDSLGLFSVLGTLFGFLFRVLAFLSQLILALIVLLFSLPFLLFGRDAPIITRSPPPPFPTLPPVGPQIPPTSNALWELVRSIFLWGSLIVIIVFALRQFVRQHDGIAAALRKSRVANWLILAWQWLYRNADKTRGSLSRALAEGWQSIVSRLEGRRILPPVGLISLRSLDPRRQIYFFYLAMIRRASEQGLMRKPSQTPSEYAVQLENALPLAKEDVDSITDAFIEARYSRQDVDSWKAEKVKTIWGRIRRALQSKAKSEQSGNN